MIIKAIETKNKIPILEVSKFLRQTLSVLDYCLKLKIVHRDIKSENILIDKEGNYKICDFGIGKIVQNMNAHTLTFAQTGTFEYMPPENQIKIMHENLGDIWSLGITLFYMCELKLPFPLPDNPFHIFEIIRSTPVPNLTGEYYKNFNDIYRNMVVCDPLKRLSAKNLLEKMDYVSIPKEIEFKNDNDLHLNKKDLNNENQDFNNNILCKLYQEYKAYVDNLRLYEAEELLKSYKQFHECNNLRKIFKAKLNFLLGKYSKAEKQLKLLKVIEDAELKYDYYRMLIEIEIFKGEKRSNQTLHLLSEEALKFVLANRKQNNNKISISEMFISESIILYEYYLEEKKLDSIQNLGKLLSWAHSNMASRYEIGRL